MMEENKTIEQQPLIKGCFQPEEAREILSTLFHNKMQFHSITSLSVMERTGGDTSFHAKRIVELSNSLYKIEDLIKEAKIKGKYLNISCDVKITLTENPD